MDKAKSMFNILREKKSSIPSFHDITPAGSLREALEEGVALGNEVGGGGGLGAQLVSAARPSAPN